MSTLTQWPWPQKRTAIRDIIIDIQESSQKMCMFFKDVLQWTLSSISKRCQVACLRPHIKQGSICGLQIRVHVILKVFFPLYFINSILVGFFLLLLLLLVLFVCLFFASMLNILLGTSRRKPSFMLSHSLLSRWTVKSTLHSWTPEAPYNTWYSTYPRLAFIIPLSLRSLQSPNLKHSFCLSSIPSIVWWGLQNTTHLLTTQVKIICVWTIVFWLDKSTSKKMIIT